MFWWLRGLVLSGFNRHTCNMGSLEMYQALTKLTELLGVEESVLEAMLTQRIVTTRGEVFIKQRSLSDAELTRDAIVKSLYEVRTYGVPVQRDTGPKPLNF